MDKFISNDPIMRNTHHFYEMSREEQMHTNMRKLARAYELKKKEWFTDLERFKNYGIRNMNDIQLGGLTGGLHFYMFLDCLENFSTPEQIQKWLPLAKELKVMGSYCQTEIGHGSDVSGLMTTATFDKATDEFVVNTPDPRATKWWPGELGLYSSHTIIYAKLLIDGRTYGVFPFLVQLRDTKTWKLLPGVRAGDMGPKMGYNAKNNGWCQFSNVRIPRDQMLMKFAKVERDGSFSI